MMFHNHKWEDVSIDFTPPNVKLKRVEQASQEFAERAIFGVTNITQRCTKCGKLDTCTVTGRVVV